MQKIESVAKALKILTLFSTNKPEWGVSEIARELNMLKSTVYRLLATMHEMGFVRKSHDNIHYKLGLRILELGGVVVNTLDFRDVALSYLHQVSEQCGETVHIGIIDNNEAISVEAIQPQNSLKSTILVGKRAPLYCTSVGKALLAFLPVAERNNIIKNIKFEKFTSNTITDPDKLDQELKKVREQGFAVDNMEHEVGICCVAAPIWDHTNKAVASFSISGPSVRMTAERIPELAQLVLSTTQKISNELGARIGSEFCFDA
jgi:Transcriptional regulator